MSTEIKTGIIEDELIIAEKIKRQLIAIGYKTYEPAGNYDDALKLIDAEKPDMLFVDTNLGVGKDGIRLAEVVNNSYQLPFFSQGK